MARKQARLATTLGVTLEPLPMTCRACRSRMRMGHHSHRAVTTLTGVTRLAPKDLPCTNNELEQYFDTARHVERRVTGRKRASPTLVVRGSVRVVAQGASRLCSFSAADLRLTDVAAWQTLCHNLHYHHQGRRRQLRFRRDLQACLAALEQCLLAPCLPGSRNRHVREWRRAQPMPGSLVTHENTLSRILEPWLRSW